MRFRLPAGFTQHFPAFLRKYMLAPIVLGALLMFGFSYTFLRGSSATVDSADTKKSPPPLKAQVTDETPLQAQMEKYRKNDEDQTAMLKGLGQTIASLERRLTDSETALKHERAKAKDEEAKRRAAEEKAQAAQRQREAAARDAAARDAAARDAAQRQRHVIQREQGPRVGPSPAQAPLASLFELRTLRPARTSTRPLPPLANAEETAYLPLGSYAQVRMVSGVMATSQLGGDHFGNPILFTITQTFHGPWKLGEPGTRPSPSGIDVAGCLGLGKAKADLASSRAQVRVDHLACIMPDGSVYEPDVKGFLIDRDGTLGLVGEVYTHDSAKIGKAFVAGMIQEASAAFGLAKSQIVITDKGLSGMPGNASNSVLQQIATYWLEQARALQPTLWVHAGTTGYLVLQKGLPLYGYPVAALVKGVM